MPVLTLSLTGVRLDIDRCRVIQIIEAVDSQASMTNAQRSELLDVAFIYFFNQFRM